MTNADTQTLSRDDVPLTAAFLIALAATLGALFIGEVLGQMPCTLCWYQRIAMFPLVPILGLSLWRGDGIARPYALPLVLDDVLMSFDDVRASDALGVLHDLAPGLQVIVFTHHMHVADAAVATTGVTVARLPGPTPISGAIDGDHVRAHAQDGAVSGDSSPRPALADGRQVDPAEVRRWAESRGLDVNARGRVSQALIDQYRAAHSQ